MSVLENRKTASSAPATVAKIRVLKGKMFTREQFSELMACSTVQDAAGYLRDSEGYSAELAGVDTNTVHRGMLENILRRSAFMTYMRITGFEQLNRQGFYNFRLLWSETEEILRCIRFINADSEGYINDAPIYINEYISFDLMQLAQVRSFGDLIDLLGRSRYAETLRPLAPEKGEKADYTACEMALRRLYYDRITADADKFDRETSARLRELIGAHNDLTNIINSYRMKMYFHEDASHISRMMLPYGKMTAAKLPLLYEFADESMFRSQLSKTRYGRSLKRSGLEWEELENAVFRLKYYYARRALSVSQDAPLSVYAFSYLSDNEVSNIIRVIESIRYKVPASETERLLIL